MPTFPKTLSLKQRRFIEEYLLDLNAAGAAKRAGYSERRAKQQGYDLLQRPDVQSVIATEIGARSERMEVTQDMVVEGLLKIAQDDGASPASRVSAWTQLGKHLGMFVERKDVTLTGELAHKHESLTDTDRWLAELVSGDSDDAEVEPRLQ